MTEIWNFYILFIKSYNDIAGKLDINFSRRITITSSVKTKTINNFAVGIILCAPSSTSHYVGFKAGSILNQIASNAFNQVTFTADSDSLTATSNTSYGIQIYCISNNPYYTQA